MITLAVTAPPGPPADGAAFLDRLEPGWLEAAYAGDASRLGAVAAARRNLADVSLRYRTLLVTPRPRPGRPRHPGRCRRLVLHPGRHPRAVRRRSPGHGPDRTGRPRRHQPATPSRGRSCWPATTTRPCPAGCRCGSLYERGRSLGVGVQVSAQSWQGLGRDDDERRRIAATADGGIWLMRTPYPQPVSELAGTRRVIETATKVVGGVWGDEGVLPRPARLDRRPRHRPPPRSRAGRVHPRRRVHLGPDRPAPPLPAAPARPAAAEPVVIPPAAGSRPAAVSARPPPDDLHDVFGPEARP